MTDRVKLDGRVGGGLNFNPQSSGRPRSGSKDKIEMGSICGQAVTATTVNSEETLSNFSIGSHFHGEICPKLQPPGIEFYNLLRGKKVKFSPLDHRRHRVIFSIVFPRSPANFGRLIQNCLILNVYP